MTGTDTKNNNKYLCNKCKDKNYLIQCKCGCGKVRPKRNKQGYIKEFLFNHHFNLPENKRDQTGFNNSQWKTGRTKKNDYWYIRLPEHIHSDKHGYVAEHVYFYTQYHKCCMLKWGVVHHKDENKENNMPWNLEEVMWGNHTSYHSKKDMSGRRCLICDTDITSYKIRKGVKHYNWAVYKNGFICNKCKCKKYRDENK